MHVGLVQAGGHPGVDDLGVVAHGGVELAQRGVVVGGQAALLFQLPLRSFKGVLPLFQLTGGQLPQLLLHGIAELPHHADGAVGKIRQDARAAVVMHHFAGGGPAVFQQCSVLGQGDDPPFKQRLAGQCLFKMDRIAHFLQRPFFRHSAGFLLPSLRQNAVCCQ